MDFTTISFLAFVLALATLYQLVPRRWRTPVLLIGSYFFYYLNSSRLLALLALDSLFVFSAALLLAKLKGQGRRLALMCVTVVGLVGTLIFFKGVFLLSGAWVRHVIVPMGVSYYTFKLLGYLIDVYQDVIEPETDLAAFLAYVSFFPQIVAGPIQRSEGFLPQVHRSSGTTRQSVLLGMQRILLGFFKKFVVADNLAILVNFVYGHLHSFGQPVILGFYAYPLQMYADFSALTDISIGVALLFGIASPENFEAPFAAVSPTDYWRRWHITLTKWLTDYVFMPLRMATRRFGNLGLAFSLTINMVLIGLWHGFRWTFVVFGLVHACYLSIDALSGKIRREYYKGHPFQKRAAGWMGPFFTFHLVAVAFVCFRADSLKDIVLVLSQLGSSLNAWTPEFVTFVETNTQPILVGLVGYGVAEVFDWLRRRDARVALVPGLPRWGRWSIYSCSGVAVCLLVMILLVSKQKHSAFLYAIF